MIDLDEAIRARYRSQPRAVDEILCDPKYAAAFADSVSQACGDSIASQIVLKSLITLRKRGERKGGLRRQRPR